MTKPLKTFCCTQSSTILCARWILKAPLAAETELPITYWWLCNELSSFSTLTFSNWVYIFCYVSKPKYLLNWRKNLSCFLKYFLTRELQEMRSKHYAAHGFGLHSWLTIMLHFLYCKGTARTLPCTRDYCLHPCVKAPFYCYR